MTERATRFPERIGRYDVLLPIASGGMGTVYLARATSIGGFEREVALKLIHAHLKENSSFAGDLVEEAKLTVRIRHPNVVSVIDVGEDPFGIYLVMDYVEGDTLAGLIKRAVASSDKQLPIRFGLKLLLDALTGLHAAHELKDSAGNPTGLVHRDFSPQNILVGVDGIGRLTDFGIAKAANRISDTSTGIIKGKIAYMAPEQARGAPVDRRTDIWAAGVVAWQLITGRKLHGGQDNEVATLLKIASEPPPRLREVMSDVPPLLDEAVGRALMMEPAQRWSTAQAFKQALQNACKMHGETADTDEVASFVSRVVEPVIAQRRARIEEILQLRAKVEKLAGHSDPSVPMTPSGQIVGGEPVTLVITEAKTTPLQRPLVSVALLDATRTDATSVTEAATRVAPGRSRWSPLAYVAAGVVVASCVFALLVVMARSTAAPVPAALPSTAPDIASAPPAVATTHDVLPTPPLPATTAETRAVATPSARPQATTPVVIARPRATKTTTAATNTSELPHSPYESHP